LERTRDKRAPLITLAVMVAPAPDANLPVVVAIVAGLFSLLGAFAGAVLARRSEYMKWLRENRSQTYARFLELISSAYTNALNAFHDRAFDDLERSIKATEAYVPAMDYARVVRLYLPEAKREAFSKLVHDIWSLHLAKELGDSRIAKVQAKFDEVSRFLESNL
jgi:hypothetical protein